jgi:hypothetical protein
MTTSGTYAFNPSIGEIVLYAYNVIGIRRTAVLQEHMVDARMGMNFMLAEWANRGVNLWKVALNSTPLAQGTATYSVPANCAMILDAVIETQSTSANPIDRIITPVSRTEYMAQPNKQLQALPTMYWFDRLLQPTITLWPVPDGNGPYLLNFYYVSQVQDANYTSGQTPDIPYLWLRALASGLAAELAPIYAPEREQVRRMDAERSFQIASTWNTENVPTYLSPAIGGYFR